MNENETINILRKKNEDTMKKIQAYEDLIRKLETVNRLSGKPENSDVGMTGMLKKMVAFQKRHEMHKLPGDHN